MQQERSAGKVFLSAMQMALVGVDYRNKEMKIHINKFDMVNSMMVPELADKNGAKASDRWDFTKARRHVLDCYGFTPLEKMKLWAKDMKTWTKDESHDQQDNKWLYTLVRDSCEPDLRMKVDKEFLKLGKEYRVGCMYFYLIMQTICNITEEVATALQERLQEFGEKGL